MTLEDLARWVFEELDPELSYILWHDHYHPLYVTLTSLKDLVFLIFDNFMVLRLFM
jgi:hypothetical protein